MKKKKIKIKDIDTKNRYNGEKLLTYDCLFNFVVGARSLGKTFWYKYKVIKDFLKSGKQFVYLRRYKSELDEVGKFFDDIKEYFPDVEFNVKGKVFYINKEVCGTAIALSTGLTKKSTPMPKVMTIIFDEFLIDNSTFYKYLKNEVKQFFELYLTIDRYKNVKVFFLSNALSENNPYFLYFGIRINKDCEYNKVKDEIIVHVPIKESINFQNNIAKKSRINSIIKDTTYGEYAVNNKFLLDNYDFIEKKTGKLDYWLTLKHNNKYYGVYRSFVLGKIWISKDYNLNCGTLYAMTLEDHTFNTMLIRGYQSPHLKLLVECFKDGVIRYENLEVKNAFYDMMSKYINR